MRFVPKLLFRLAMIFAVVSSAYAQCNWQGVSEACGPVGIGTLSPDPGTWLHVRHPTFGSSTYALLDRNSPGSDGGYLFRTQDGITTQWFIGKLGASNSESLAFAYGNPMVTMMNIDAAGNVTVNGNIAARYQDVAEWVPSAGSYDAGTVVVLSSDAKNKVTIATKPYDTGVAGVISPRPGVLLGESGVDKAIVATTGRVYVKVDASKHPIAIGDLLVTSDRPGFAMPSEPIQISGRSFHQPGTILGKALEPLSSGQGEILVLLALQ